MPASPSEGEGEVHVTRRIGVGLVGYSFMGRAHSAAWRNVAAAFELGLVPDLVVLCGRDRAAATAAATRLGWSAVETDWRRVVDRDDVGIVDICTPGASHAEIAIAALRAGKHVLCEKPLARSLAEAEEMAAEAVRAHDRFGTLAMVGFNYRRLPAVELARRLVASGRIGELRHVRACYLQDWLVDADVPLSWRLVRSEAGSGSLGDIAAHAIDLAQHVSGAVVTAVSAATTTFVATRPLAAGTTGLASRATTAAGGEVSRGEVSVDDAALFLARLSGGAVGTFEATRYATGHKNALRVELNGSLGSLAFDLERLNELELYEQGNNKDPTSGWRRILVTEPEHPYLAGWWPPGHVLGWEHSFVHEAADLLAAIEGGGEIHPSFADGLDVQRVLDAVERSASSTSFVATGLVPEPLSKTRPEARSDAQLAKKEEP
ncbi:MAG: Gfo/Idh/MocA family protein [Acidimicrobiales bacterium]